MQTVRRVLIVEDDLEMMTVLRDFLQGRGYIIATTSSVPGALSWLRRTMPQEYPDIILSDIKMGLSSGLDLVRVLALERPQLPVILFSVVESMEREALECGAKRFLRKPFPLVRLEQVLVEVLSDALKS